MTLNGGTLHLAINGGVNAHNTTVGGNAIIVSDRSSGGSGVTNTLGPLGLGTQTLSVAVGTNVTSGTAVTAFGATTLSGNATFDVAGTNAQLTLTGPTTPALAATPRHRSAVTSSSPTAPTRSSTNYRTKLRIWFCLAGSNADQSPTQPSL